MVNARIDRKRQFSRAYCTSVCACVCVPCIAPVVYDEEIDSSSCTCVRVCVCTYLYVCRHSSIYLPSSRPLGTSTVEECVCCCPNKHSATALYCVCTNLAAFLFCCQRVVRIYILFTRVYIYIYIYRERETDMVQCDIWYIGTSIWSDAVIISNILSTTTI